MDINNLKTLRKIVWQTLEKLIDPPKPIIADYEREETPLLEVEEVIKEFNEAASKLQEKRDELGLTEEDLNSALLLIGSSLGLLYNNVNYSRESFHNIINNSSIKFSYEEFEEFCKSKENIEKVSKLTENIKDLCYNSSYKEMYSVIFNKLKDLVIMNEKIAANSFCVISIILVLWNLAKVFKSSLKLCKALKESNKEFREIIAGNEPTFSTCFKGMKIWANEMIKILKLDDSQFDIQNFNKFKEYLGEFLKSTTMFIELLKTTMATCLKQTNKLKEEKKEFDRAANICLLISGIIFGAGLGVYRLGAAERLSSTAKKAGIIAAAAGGVGLAGGITFKCVWNARINASIERHEAILKQLKALTNELTKDESNLRFYKAKDHENMNSDIRKALESIINDFETKCESLFEIFIKIV